MHIDEVAKCTCAPDQLVDKAFNCILRAQSFPDVVTIEWKRKVGTDKTWAKFKTHFSRKIRNYQEDQGLTAKQTCDSANSDD